MESKKQVAWWRQDQFGWGLMLIVIGTWILLAMNGTLPEESWRTWWPYAVVAMGVVGILGARDEKSLGSGVTTFAIGWWLAAAVHHWGGLTWKNSWPLVLVATGLGTIVEWAASLVTARRKEGDHVC